MTMTNAANTTASSPSKTSTMNAEYLTGLLTRKESIEALLLSIEWKLLIFGAFVVVGVAGESWYGYKTWRGNKELRAVQKQIDEEQDRKSKAEVDETKAQVAKANESAAQLSVRAASLEKEATVAKLELERLRARQQPRIITEAQETAFISLTKPYAKGKVRILAITPDNETLAFTQQIGSLLEKAGFPKPRFDADLASLTLNGEEGLSVAISVKNSESPPAHAGSVQQAFTKIGIKVEGIKVTDDIIHMDEDEAVLVVSPRR